MRLRQYSAVIKNASALVSTTAITSALGFLYWGLAARIVGPADLGFLSSVVSAINLISIISVFGLGTVLVGKLARSPEDAREFLTTSLLVVTLGSLVLGTGFLMMAPVISNDLRHLPEQSLGIVAVLAGVALSANALIVDNAFVGLMRSSLQLRRNIIASVTKLLLLALTPFVVMEHAGVMLALLWSISIAISFLLLAPRQMLGWLAHPQGLRLNFGMLQRVGPTALAHHVLNLALAAPVLLLPLVVASVLSLEATAYFYVPWMIAGLLFSIPASLAAVLYAVAAADIHALARTLRFSIGLSFVVNLVGCLMLLLIAPVLLSMFGSGYAANSTHVLYVLGFSSLPVIVKVHYITISRVLNRIRRATLYAVIGGTLELMLAFVGAKFGGIAGLGVGWTIAVCLGALITGRAVFRSAYPKEGSSSGVQQLVVQMRHTESQ